MTTAAKFRSTTDYVRLFANPRIAAVLALGFSSGLPLTLSGYTLKAWLATLHVDIATIGLFSLVGLPYSLKFLWSPVMDRYVPPFWGRRRGWIFIMQLALAAILVLMALTDPVNHTLTMAVLAFALAFASASQDIVYNAYFTDLLPAEERGLGAAASVGGYRAAMIVSGAVVLILSEQIGWRNSYLLMALLMVLATLPTWLGPEPRERVAAPRTLAGAVVEPIVELLRRPGAIGLLSLVVLYKFGDWFSGQLTGVFLIEGLHFSAATVGVVNKGFGIAATIVGVFFGGTLMAKLGLYRSLLYFGLLQAVSILGYTVLSMVGRSYIGLVAAVAVENLAWGMGTAALFAYLMALCDHRYTAVQFALLSALDSISRVFLGPLSGLAADRMGWTAMFAISIVLALPGLVLLIRIRPRIEAAEHSHAPAAA
jgi:PAT family beta-lactamase induction signal transducer AmpG